MKNLTLHCIKQHGFEFFFIETSLIKCERKLLHGLGLYSSTTHFFYTSFKSKERPAKINFMPAKLHAVLVSTESDCCALYKSISDFRKILIRDSALC